MSSRFVPAGTQAEPSSGSDDWAKARQQVEDQRRVKSEVEAHQEAGKSLYDVLQANKAAKQEAFEEASKLKNQFRPLDDSEIEFLDSIRKTERAKEFSEKLETAEQVEQFRKQRAMAEQRSVNFEDGTQNGDQRPEQDSWTTTRKRRRDKSETDVSVGRIKRSSIPTRAEESSAQTAIPTNDKSIASTGESVVAREPAAVAQSQGATGNSGGGALGLVGYDSEED